MNKKTTYGALGIAVLFVFAMSAVPGAAVERDALDLTVPTGHGDCALSLPGDACQSAVWTYGGQAPALNGADAVAAAGEFTVRIQEQAPFENWCVEYSFAVVVVAGEAIVSEGVDTDPEDCNFSPSSGWPVTTIGSASGVAVPSISASHA